MSMRGSCDVASIAAQFPGRGITAEVMVSNWLRGRERGYGHIARRCENVRGHGAMMTTRDRHNSC
jgi:hypothetical protein